MNARQDKAINDLNVIHIAGTKGKGSTCAFVRAFLQTHGSRTGFPSKVGMYTSPHLRSVRERFEINGTPISQDLFAKYFFEVWETFAPPHEGSVNEDRIPRYLQMMALLAVHIFIREGTEATICETHNGGEFDATNIFEKPVATGITTIGLDHILQLGPTLQNIAWHKAGIFKAGSKAFSVVQDSSVTSVLDARAQEKGTYLTYVDINDSLPSRAPNLQARVQRLNCSLALSMANGFLESKKGPGNRLSSDDVSRGVERFSWPGRFQIIRDSKCTWFVDGAHNDLSVRQAAEWFSKYTTPAPEYALCF